MAVPTVTLDPRTPVRLGNTPFGMLDGGCTTASYDTAHPAVTAITGKFKVAPRVTVSGVTSNGFLVRWDATTSSFIAYQQSAASGAMIEALNGANLGSWQFHAMGQLG